MQWGIFAAFATVTFCVFCMEHFLFSTGHIADDLPLDHMIVFGGREVNLSVKPVLRFIAIGGSLLIALITGGAMASEWPTLALFWFAPAAAGHRRRSHLRQAVGLFSLHAARMEPDRRLAAHHRRDHVLVGRLVHSHHRRIARVRRAQRQLHPIALAGTFLRSCVSVARSRHSHVSRPIRATV